MDKFLAVLSEIESFSYKLVQIESALSNITFSPNTRTLINSVVADGKAIADKAKSLKGGTATTASVTAPKPAVASDKPKMSWEI